MNRDWILLTSESLSLTRATDFVADPAVAIAMDLSRSAVTINRQYSRSDERLQHGDELALIPPVSGG